MGWSAVLVSAAFAGEVRIDKRGMLPAYVAVDGELLGRAGKKDHAVLSLADGLHELWFTRDAEGVFTACRGVVQVGTEPALVAVGDGRCDGLDPIGVGPATWGRGAALRLEGDGEAWVAIDGGRPLTWLAGLEANLAPGAHMVAVTGDGSSSICHGRVTLDPGETSTFVLAGRSCTGFDHELHLRIAP